MNSEEAKAKKYDIAAYIWPSYTGHEDRTRIFWPDGIGEWQTVQKAYPRFEGHQWPRKPLLGYKDEAESATMAEQIDLAASHGVNVFIYDWYWYDRRPFLENCLNEGYLPAARKDPRVKFYLMWANHNAGVTWDFRNANRDLSGHEPPVWRGDIDRAEFRIVCRRVIDRYFFDPLYYTIDGKPVFSIYEPHNFIKGQGGIDKAREALDEFREMCVKAGLPGVHIQMVLTHAVDRVSPNATTPGICGALGFDSITHYQFVHFVAAGRPYSDALEDAYKEWQYVSDSYKIPYFPHVSVGWDASPRFTSITWDGTYQNNTPDLFGGAMQRACAYADAHPGQPPLITVNSWNEWTEGSYLLPDDLHGYGYLNEIKKIQSF